MAVSQTYFERRTKTPFHLEVSNLTTRSIYGWKTGFDVGVNYKGRLLASYVHLNEIGNGELQSHSFRGGNFQYYFNPKNDLNIGLGITAGLYNKRFASIHPTLNMRYLYRNRLVVGLGVSRLDRYPKFDFKLGFRLF